MTKRSIILTLIAAALLVPSTDAAASVFKKKKKKAQTEATAAQKPAPKKKQTPYEKLMKEVADSACGGTFNIEIDGDMFKAIVEMPIIQEDTAEKTVDKTE